ncbi:LacI family DNA-binding transcriptional regulator [Nigerium massiliense]|uniref:LacI family DNA-binding transcriptional regulator n=1 Tax=Nigerium massiliense TaxID=1522317 RepID=UPI00058C878A|nr:LacI family DNA-binding transcriptional regulator [Nigerium massiliense]
MKRPTLVSLARELGVSRQTVSNVLNAPHLVKPETRERVQAAITASGYRPNVAAQSLRKRRSMTLAMRIYPTLDGINGAVMDRFLHHLVDALRGRGYHLLLVTADSFDDEVEVLRDMHERGRIDGCILTDSHVDDDRPTRLADDGLAVCAFGRPWGRTDEASHIWVDVDGAAGTRKATEHLLRAGHRRIAFLGWTDSSDVGNDRRRGWEDGLRAAGLPGEALELRTESVDRFQAGFEAAERLLSRGADAAVCASDSLALGALEAFRRRGITLFPRAPIVGFDNTPIASASGLSSVDQCVEDAAEALTARFTAHLSRQGPSPTSEAGARLLEPELVVRELGSLFTP